MYSYKPSNGTSNNLIDDSKNDIKPDNSVNIQDSISSLAWMSMNGNIPSNYFASVGWDSTLRLYEVNQANYGSSIVQKSTTPLGVPALSCCWALDNSKIFIGCIDGSIKAVDTNNMAVTDVGKHTSGVSSLHIIPNQNILISTAYEKNIQFWQMGNPNPAFTLDVGNKVFASDFKNNLFVGGTANEKLVFFDVANINQKTILDSVDLGKFSQLQSISLSKNGDILGTTSCDGRANISNITKQPNTSYKLSSIITFKSNKQEESGSVVLYPVNASSFNPATENWFMTAGSDGVMSFWDFKARNKIKSFSFASIPVCDAKVSPSGQLVAYALGNDWHIGSEGIGKW